MLVTLNGSESTVFVEGTGVDVQYLNITQVLSNNTSDRFNFREVNSNKKMYFVFNAENELIQNKIYTSESTKSDLNKSFGDDYSINPFKDIKKTNVLIKNSFQRNLNNSSNGNINFIQDESKVFIDKTEETTQDLINDNDLNPQIDYPFSFNYNNFFARGSRIDAFSNVSKIKRTQTVIDDLKGFRQNGVGTSKNAFGNNNRIEKYFTKNDDTTFHYEDDVNNKYLYSNQDNMVIDKIIKNINHISGVSSTSVIKKKKNIISQETRYFAFKEVKENPFREKDYRQNSWWVKNNIYKFSNENINDTINSNREKDQIIEEDKIYLSLGRDLDKSINSISESIVFHESLN